MRALVVTDVSTNPAIIPVNTLYMMSVGVEEQDVRIQNWGELAPYMWGVMPSTTWGVL